MTKFIQGNTMTRNANGSVAKFRCVRMTSDENVNINSSATTLTIGVSAHSASSGENLRINFDGTTKIEAAAQIVRGAYLRADESGKVRTTTTAGDNVVGTALESTTQTETTGGTEVIEVDLTARGSRY